MITLDFFNRFGIHSLIQPTNLLNVKLSRDEIVRRAETPLCKSTVQLQQGARIQLPLPPIPVTTSTGLYAVSRLIGGDEQSNEDYSACNSFNGFYHWPSTNNTSSEFSMADSTLIYRPPSVREQTEALSHEYPASVVPINTDQLQFQRMSSFRKSLIHVSILI